MVGQDSGSLDVFGPKILTPSDGFVQTLVTFFSAEGEAKEPFGIFANLCVGQGSLHDPYWGYQTMQIHGNLQ